MNEKFWTSIFFYLIFAKWVAKMKGWRPYDYDSDGDPDDPREDQNAWDAHVRSLLQGKNHDSLESVEDYIDEGYIDVKNDTLYSNIFECEIPLLCVAIELNAPLRVMNALLDRGARIDVKTERRATSIEANGDYELQWITPMSVAIRQCNPVAVKVLLDRGVNPLMPTCWTSTFTLSDDQPRSEPHDRPRRTVDALRYAVDMGIPSGLVSFILRHHRLSPSSLDPHIEYLESVIRTHVPLEPSRAALPEYLQMIREARTLYARLDTAECSLWTMKYAIRQAWRDLGPVIARHILADVVVEKEEGDESEKESVSKKLKK